MASHPNTARNSAAKPGIVLGRSAATGRFVLKPATKGSSITVKEASQAARDAQGKSK